MGRTQLKRQVVNTAVAPRRNTKHHCRSTQAKLVTFVRGTFGNPTDCGRPSPRTKDPRAATLAPAHAVDHKRSTVASSDGSSRRNGQRTENAMTPPGPLNRKGAIYTWRAVWERRRLGVSGKRTFLSLCYSTLAFGACCFCSSRLYRLFRSTSCNEIMQAKLSTG